MGTFFDGALLDQIFLLSAVAGGVFFLLRLGMSVLMGDSGGHAMDHGGGAGDGAHQPGDSDASFHVLTIQGLTAFFLFGGLAGLAADRQMGAGDLLSTLLAFAVGLAGLFGNAYLVKTLLGLQSSGTMNINSAIGKEGVVYLTIHPGGGGQVQIEVNGALQIFEAVCESGKEIPTGERVWVVGVVNGPTLSVEHPPV